MAARARVCACKREGGGVGARVVWVQCGASHVERAAAELKPALTPLLPDVSLPIPIDLSRSVAHASWGRVGGHVHCRVLASRAMASLDGGQGDRLLRRRHRAIVEAFPDEFACLVELRCNGARRRARDADG